jgi:hypothetical protein
MSKETPKDDPRQKTDAGSHVQTDSPGKATRKRNNETTVPKSTLRSGTNPARTRIGR